MELSFWMLFTGLRECFVMSSRNLATRNSIFTFVCDAAYYVFLILTIFFAPAWWYIFIAMACNFVGSWVGLAVAHFLGTSSSEIWILLCLLLFVPTCIVLMYLSLFDVI